MSNRMTGVTSITLTANGTLTTSSTYEYDVDDRRISKDVISDETDFIEVHERYVYDDVGNVSVVTDVATGQTQVYLHGPDGEEPLAEQAAGGALSWNLADHQGSVRKVLSATGGTALRTIDYDGYGRVVSGIDPLGTNGLALGVTAHDSGDGIAVGSTDSQWQVRRLDPSATNWTSATVLLGGSYWMVNGAGDDPDVKWIGFNAQYNGGPGTFEYRTTIWVPAGVTSLPLNLAVDNNLLSVKVTGPDGVTRDAGLTLTATTNGGYDHFQQWHTYDA